MFNFLEGPADFIITLENLMKYVIIMVLPLMKHLVCKHKDEVFVSIWEVEIM